LAKNLTFTPSHLLKIFRDTENAKDKMLKADANLEGSQFNKAQRRCLLWILRFVARRHAQPKLLLMRILQTKLVILNVSVFSVLKKYVFHFPIHLKPRLTTFFKDHGTIVIFALIIKMTLHDFTLHGHC